MLSIYYLYYIYIIYIIDIIYINHLYYLYIIYILSIYYLYIIYILSIYHLYMIYLLSKNYLYIIYISYKYCILYIFNIINYIFIRSTPGQMQCGWFPSPVNILFNLHSIGNWANKIPNLHINLYIRLPLRGKPKHLTYVNIYIYMRYAYVIYI